MLPTTRPRPTEAGLAFLLANREFPLTRTVTHVLWAMYGLVTAGSEQKPHRHQSIALDFIVDCDPGCFSLVGKELDLNQKIINPTRVDWHPGCVFVTPPGYWLTHYNTSAREARLIPVAGCGPADLHADARYPLLIVRKWFRLYNHPGGG